MLPGVITQFETHSGALPLFGIDLTANVSANTKATTYTTIATATGFAADGFFLQINRSIAARKFLLDIAIGASTFEVDIVQNYLAQAGDDFSGCHGLIDVPIAIAAGTRISGRIQSNVGSAVLDVAVYPYKKDGIPSRFTAVKVYGAATGTSSGVTIDSGAIANTKPATYTEVTSSTTGAIRALIMRTGFRANQTPQFSHWKVDIAIGAALSETILFGDLMLQCAGPTFDALVPSQWVLPVALPAGTRLSARAACSIADATDRLIEIEFVGLEGVAISGAGPYVGSQGLVVV